MGGIEVYAISAIFMLGIAGLIRGPAKELGVTMTLVVLLAVLAQFEALDIDDKLPGSLNDILTGFGLGTDNVMSRNMVAWMVYVLMMALTTFLAYHGQETLAFQKWKGPSGILGLALGGFVGAFNGYLIFGTLWYYMQKLDYPMQQYAWFEPRFSKLANDMAELLPQNIASGLIMGALALALLWWRILK